MATVISRSIYSRRNHDPDLHALSREPVSPFFDGAVAAFVPALFVWSILIWALHVFF